MGKWDFVDVGIKSCKEHTMKYTNEILNTALSELQNMDIKERKKAATIFMKAVCAEPGTVNTKPVKEWFVLNIENYLTAIKDETDSEILWRNLYTLQQFCGRYIHLAYLFKINSDIITEDNVKNVEKRAKAYVYSLLEKHRKPKVLQGIASFFWVYREPFVWDIFAEVLKNKKDRLTLSHIGIAIRQCYDLSKEDDRNIYISDSQIKKLIEILETNNILNREIELLRNL